MREIRFRAWDKRENNWVDYPIYIDVNGVIYWEHYEMGLKEADDIIVMQSAGLVDKNGVEIFEGDIVNHYWSNEVGESFCHKTVIKNPFDYKVYEAMHLIYADEIEILGNIWENPELLEGE